MKTLLKCTISIIIALLLASSVSAQNTGIQGRLVDRNTGEKLVFVNCVLSNPDNIEDVIAGMAADTNGMFMFRDIPKQDMVLSFSFVGYKKRSIDIKASELGSGVLDLGDIGLEPDSELMDEVEIIALKDRIVVDSDKMTVNIDKNTASTVNNVFELLKKAPGITIDNDDNLKLNGKSGVLIQFQGRDMKLPWKSMVQILKGMPSSTVDRIEIINNPSAKYDAEGVGGIINLIFGQEKNQGWNASLGGRVYYSDLVSAMSDLNLNYVDDKWTSTLSFSSTAWGHKVGSYSERKTGIGEDTIIFTDVSDMLWKSQNYNLSFGSDYLINPKNSVGFYFAYSKNKMPEQSNPHKSLVSTLRNGLRIDSLRNESITGLSNNNDNYLLNLNYLHKFDSLGQNLSFNFDLSMNSSSDFYGSSNKYYNLLINQIDPYKTESLENLTSGSYGSYSLRGDYFEPFGKDFSLETGFKLAYTKVDNALEATRDGVDDVGRSNNFILDENINAIYASMKKGFGPKTSMRLGLRFENTNLKGNQIKYDSVFRQTYSDLFPNLSLAHSFSDISNLNLTYGMRISRPSYSNLNPFHIALNDFSYKSGNTELKPQYTHNISLQHSFMYVLFTNLTYSYTKDIVTEMPIIGDNGIISSTMPMNIQNSHNLNLSLSTSIPIKPWLMVVAYLSENYSNSSATSEEINFENEVFSFMGYGSVNITFPKKYRLDVSGYYTSGGAWGLYKYKSFYGLNLNATKSFFKDKIEVNAGINNLISSKNTDVSYSYDNTIGYTTSNMNFRMYTIGLRLNLGKRLDAKLNVRDDRYDERVSGKQEGGGMQGGFGR